MSPEQLERKNERRRIRRRQLRGLSADADLRKTGRSPEHGLSLHELYPVWITMIQRCMNPACHSWPNYGGRGITVCERWLASPAAFIEDMGPRPPGLTLERIENDGGYEPDNCRWATRQEQRANRRDTVTR